MKDRYTFEDLKDEATLIKFLEKVWKVGAITGKVNCNKPISELIQDYMPNFEEELESK